MSTYLQPQHPASDERVVQEIQAAITVARRFPRDRRAATTRILLACEDFSLAHEGLYSFPRGKTPIIEISIRLAELMASEWQNMQYGVRELSRGAGYSQVEAFAWDLEANVSSRKEFTVVHTRTVDGKAYQLSQERDIYEHVANAASRRLRACILAILPHDLKTAARQRCIDVRKRDIQTPDYDQLRSSFSELRISESQITAFLGHPLEQSTPAEINSLRTIYTSIRDEVSSAEDWFPPSTPALPKKAALKTQWPMQIGAHLFNEHGIPWQSGLHSSEKTLDGRHWKPHDGLSLSAEEIAKEERRAYEKLPESVKKALHEAGADIPRSATRK